MEQTEDMFNYYLSARRQVIERAFGMLVQRWRILKQPLCQRAVSRIIIIVRTCVVLHNLCINNNILLDMEDLPLSGSDSSLGEEEEEEKCEEVNSRKHEREKRDGKLKRDTLRRWLIKNL